MCLSLAASFIFLCNIVRVLIIKLRAGPHVGNGPSPSALQAVRATLLLLPLLGLHYLITPFRPESTTHPLLSTYEVLSAVFTSFQVRGTRLPVTLVLYSYRPALFLSNSRRKLQRKFMNFKLRRIVGTKVFLFSLCTGKKAETVIFMRVAKTKDKILWLETFCQSLINKF